MGGGGGGGGGEGGVTLIFLGLSQFKKEWWCKFCCGLFLAVTVLTQVKHWTGKQHSSAK